MANNSSKDKSDKASGDSSVQDGKDVVKQEQKRYEVSEEQQEFIDNANNNTQVANEDPANASG